ncbi:MAG: hypothetical protein JSW22_04975 [Chloroflexota bacterium]|nr:MAG: hypothetical protein JSW22_04975 [Chloroflexota bacterium]
MWKEEEKKKEESLLEELCGDDAELYSLLSRYLYFNPLAAISEKDLDVLAEEAGEEGDFRPAVDKAIFEGAQNPGERERYIEVIRNLALKAKQAVEQEKENAEKEGLIDRAARLGRRTENYRVMSERTEDIINVASKFYNERLMELGEEAAREARREERERAQDDEWRIEDKERAERAAREKEREKMGREEKREAEIQDKREELVVEEKKKAREEAREEAEMEERRIGEREKTEREARKREREQN